MGSSAFGPNPNRPRKRARILYENRISLYAFLAALPGLLVSGILVWMQPWSVESRIALIGAEVFVWWLLALALQEQTTRPLQTLANVVGSLREEDYSFRARNAVAEDALGELSIEVNALADMLSDQKIRAIEATALLQRVVDEIDAPLFAFDPGIDSAAGESCWRTSAASIASSNAWTYRRGTQPGTVPHRQQREPCRPERECIAGPLAATEEFLPAAWRAPYACRSLRCQPRSARRGTTGLAAADSRTGTRIEQFARADQVNCRKP